MPCKLATLGASDWSASALDQISNVNETSLNTYDSSLHAVELNVLPASNTGVQLFLGTRFVGFDEDVSRLTDRVNVDLTNNTATGLNDELNVLKIDNRLVGAHFGLRRDVWSRNQQFSLESLINGGPFCNLITRENIDQTYVTVNPPDDPGTTTDESLQTEVRVDRSVQRRRTAEFAFFGEAALTAVYRFHPNASARAGYQAVWMTGANLASDTWRDTSTVFFHGLHWGLEYRR